METTKLRRMMIRPRMVVIKHQTMMRLRLLRTSLRGQTGRAPRVTDHSLFHWILSREKTLEPVAATCPR